MPISHEGVPFVNRETSRRAADSVSDVADIRMRIYGRILQAGASGRTCDELEIEFGRIHETVSARIWDLNGGNPRLQPLIVDSGARRPTRRNRKAIVWVAKRITSDLFNRVETPVVKQEMPDKPWTRERVAEYMARVRAKADAKKVGR